MMPQVNVIPSAVSVTIDLERLMSTLRALVLDPEFSHRMYSLDQADVLLAFSTKIRDGYANDPEFVEEPPTIPPTEPLAAKIVAVKPVPGIRIDVTPAPEGEANPV
jgi:hypothetical protein